MINKYIKELLNEHSRVIVPDLGAFLHKGESTKVLYFNEFLRFNDGLLLNHIAEQEKIDKIEAAKQIKAYIEETNKSLQAKKKVVIEGVGSLYLDNNDKIQLETSGSSESITSESLPQTDTTNVEASEPLLIIENKFEEPRTEFIPPIPPTPAEKEVINERIITEIKEQAKVKTPPVVKSQKFRASTHGAKISKPEANSNKTILWIASIAVLVIISLVYYFVIKPLYFNKTEKKNAVITNTNLDTIVTTQADTISENMEPAKKMESAIPMASSKGKKFYLVVGCFVQENNADKTVQKLRNEGFSSEKFAKIEQMYFVSIASFGDKASAEKQLLDLKSKGHTEIWIKYY